MGYVSATRPNGIDRNASSPGRIRRNMQRLSQGAATDTIKLDNTTLKRNTLGQIIDTLVVNETPSGVIDGSNAAFNVANPPQAGTLIVTVDGVMMREGIDYTLSTSTLTFFAGAIPQTGDWILATYRK